MNVKFTLGHFVKGILTTKLDSVTQCIYTVLIRVTGDCKRKPSACRIAILQWNMLVNKDLKKYYTTGTIIINPYLANVEYRVSS
jgi:hypothetical protein